MEIRLLDALDLRGIDCVRGTRDLENKKVFCIHPEHNDTKGKLSIHVDGYYRCWTEGCPINEFPGRDFLSEQLGLVLDKTHPDTDKTEKELFTTLGRDSKPRPNELIIEGIVLPFNKDYRGIKAATYNELGAFTSEWANEQSYGKYERIWFPVYKDGVLINAQGRSFADVDAKYMFFTRREKYMFPEKLEPLNGVLYFVEGIFDLANLYDKGVRNVVCIFGTAPNIELEDIPGLKTVGMIFDDDTSGKKATRILRQKALECDMLTQEIVLPAGLDAGDLSQEQVNKYVKERKALWAM